MCILVHLKGAGAHSLQLFFFCFSCFLCSAIINNNCKAVSLVSINKKGRGAKIQYKFWLYFLNYLTTRLPCSHFPLNSHVFQVTQINISILTRSLHVMIKPVSRPGNGLLALLASSPESSGYNLQQASDFVTLVELGMLTAQCYLFLN